LFNSDSKLFALAYSGSLVYCSTLGGTVIAISCWWHHDHRSLS